MNVKDRESFFIGYGEVRCAPYDDYKSNDALVLSSDKSLGKKTGVSLSVEKQNRRKQYTGDIMLSEILTKVSAASLQCSLMEISLYNILTVLGMDNTSTNQTIYIDEDFTDEYLRVEAFFKYPVGDKYLGIIFPKTKVITSMSLEGGVDSPSTTNIQFDAVKNDVQWGAKYRLGKIFIYE